MPDRRCGQDVRKHVPPESVTVANVSVIVGDVSVDGSNVRVEVGNMRVNVANVSVIVVNVSVIVGNVSVDGGNVRVEVGNMRVNVGNVGVDVRDMRVNIGHVSVIFGCWRSPTADFRPSSADHDASTDNFVAYSSDIVPLSANIDAMTRDRDWQCARLGTIRRSLRQDQGRRRPPLQETRTRHCEPCLREVALIFRSTP